MGISKRTAVVNSNINVTPMVDVMLVLLIIFMVITPLTPKGLDALVTQPPPKDQKVQPPPPERTIVVQVLKSGDPDRPTLKINQDETTWDTLEGKLRDVFASRAEKVMFVKGDDDIAFSSVAQVIDIAHSAGVDKVGLITAKIEAGE